MKIVFEGIRDRLTLLPLGLNAEEPVISAESSPTGTGDSSPMLMAVLIGAPSGCEPAPEVG